MRTNSSSKRPVKSAKARPPRTIVLERWAISGFPHRLVVDRETGDLRVECQVIENHWERDPICESFAGNRHLPVF